jgi:hypothetical protein
MAKSKRTGTPCGSDLIGKKHKRYCQKSDGDERQENRELDLAQLDAQLDGHLLAHLLLELVDLLVRERPTPTANKNWSDHGSSFVGRMGGGR